MSDVTIKGYGGEGGAAQHEVREGQHAGGAQHVGPLPLTGYDVGFTLVGAALLTCVGVALRRLGRGEAL